MKTPVKISMKVHELLELFLGCQSRTSITFRCILRDETIFDVFFGKETWHYVCNTSTCTQKMSYFHVFPERGRLSLSDQGKNIMFSGKKYHLSR